MCDSMTICIIVIIMDIRIKHVLDKKIRSVINKQ